MVYAGQYVLQVPMFANRQLVELISLDRRFFAEVKCVWSDYNADAKARIYGRVRSLENFNGKCNVSRTLSSITVRAPVSQQLDNT